MSHLPYRSYTKRRGSHFKLFSDELPPINFNSSLLAKPHFREVSKKEKYDHDFYSLPPIDRPDPDMLSVSDTPRAKSESPEHTPILYKGQTSSGKSNKSKFSDISLPVKLPRKKRRDNQFNFGGYIPSESQAAARRKTVFTENKDKDANVNSQPIWRQKVTKTEKDVPKPDAETVHIASKQGKIHSPMRRHNEQVTHLIHGDNHSKDGNISITVALQRSEYHRRKQQEITGASSRNRIGYNSSTAMKDNEFVHGTVKSTRIHSEDKLPDSSDGYLSRLNESLKEQNRQGLARREKKREGSPRNLGQFSGSPSILPPITERSMKILDQMDRLVDPAETELLRRLGEDGPSARHHKPTGLWRPVHDHQILEEVEAKEVESDIHGKLSFSTPLNPDNNETGKCRNSRHFVSMTSDGSADGLSGETTQTDQIDADSVDTYGNHGNDDEIVDRSMDAIEMLKTYRIWDRKRRRFPNGLRQIVMPDTKTEDSSPLTKFLGHMKSYELMRKRKGKIPFVPVDGLTEPVSNDMRSF